MKGFVIGKRYLVPKCWDNVEANAFCMLFFYYERK